MKLLSFIVLFASQSAFAAGGYNFFVNGSHATHIPAHTLALIFGTALFLGIGLVYRANLAASKNMIVPDKGISLRNMFEGLSQSIYNTAKTVMGEKSASRYFSYTIFVFFFILINNVIGVIPGGMSPNQNLNTTLALGIFTFFYFNYQGIRAVGFINYMKHFAGPMPALAILIFPIELISISVRPLSLALRLRGNMDGDHLILGIFSELVPYLVPIPFYAMGLFVSLLQAFVFTLLTMIYIGMATSHHDHGEHEHHH
ncbi:MAG TPA: F0F1 ATP synthase subunit A [Bacteriovoracaceae bacterium]|nr:F0F1 ATP synthase subunit A [Bacteriovoracaceae bacterium]